MNVWVTADTHFEHKFLVENGYRKENYERDIILEHNRLIRDNDILIHLGDIHFGKDKCMRNWIDAINGRKILVVGNHDGSKSKNWYMKNGFDFACDQFNWELYGLELIFTHKPIQVTGDSNYHVNIHGHLHDGDHRDIDFTMDNHVHINIDKNNYRPLRLSKIIVEYLRRNNETSI